MIRTILLLAAALCALCSPSTLWAAETPQRLVLDMVHQNPGEAPTKSAFLDPQRLTDWGYNGQVVQSYVEGIPTFDAVSPGALPAGSPERAWAEEKTAALAQQVRAAHAQGLKCFAWMQVLVLPKAVMERHKADICNAQGKVDFRQPKTRELFRAQLAEIFDKVPDLDGLMIRTGEIYLQDLPHHTSTGGAILHGPESHIDILKILREEVCEKHAKIVIYRTWDFGNNFHINPAYYRQVTDQIEPHDKLFFSIKHQAGDFHQLTPFNPTLGIGKHRQIVEVQCQREAYGKGAHPYYIGQGVIDGWEEYAWMPNAAGANGAKGLRDIMANPLIAGVWTWSRGGGWNGPYITSEFWCALNTYVIAKFAENPARPEVEIFDEYARKIGLAGDDLTRFRELCLLSEKAVLRGQLTTLGASIDVWWARDDVLEAPDLRDFIRKGLVEKALAEKADAVRMWRRIEELSRQIQFPDESTRAFVTTSCTYGRIKYAIIEQAWTILFLGQLGATSGTYDRPKLAAAIAAYDELWNEWKHLKETNPACSTLHRDVGRNKPGIGAAVNRYRDILQNGAPASTAPAQTLPANPTASPR